MVFGLLFALSGCATSADLNALQDRVVKLEKSRAAVRLALKRDQHRLKRLLDEIEESTGFLRQSGAELTARIDELEGRLRKTLGALEVLNHRVASMSRHTKAHGDGLRKVHAGLQRLIADLRDRAGITILALPRNLPEKAADWVKLAQEHFEYGEVRVADAVALECTRRFAGTATAGECALIQARVAYEEHRFADALKTLQKVHDSLNARAIPVVGMALLRISEVLEAQGKCRRSADVLKYLRAEMSRLDHAKVAKVRLASIGKRCTEGSQKFPERTSGSKKRPAAAPVGAAPAPGSATATGN